MIINSVRLRNFKSHSDTTIGFGPGINVILGENGAGKTSVLEAISFALFKEYGGNLEDLVRRGGKDMGVELVFTSHGRKYRIVRTRRKSSTDSNLFLLDGGEGAKETLLQSGDSDVDAEVGRILGIDRYLFINAVYVRQGEIARLLIARPGERKQLIGRLLGIDVLEKVWDRMRVVIDGYRERKARLETRVMEGDRLRQQIEELDGQMKEVRGRMGTTRKKISGITASLKKAELEEARLNEAEREYGELSGARESASAALDMEADRLGSLQRKAAEMKKSEAELSALEKKLPPGWRKGLDESIAGLRETISGIDGKVGALRGKVGEMKELDLNLRKAGSKCPLCGSPLTAEHRQSLISEREGKIAEAEQEAESLLGKREEHAKALGKLESEIERMLQLEKRHSELKGAAGRLDDLMHGVKDSEKLIRQLKAKIRELDGRMGKLRGKKLQCERVKAGVRDLRAELSALREASGRQHGHMQELQNSRKRLEAEAREIKEKRKEHEKMVRFMSILEDIRKVFDKSGLQRELRMKSGPVIEEHMRGFFREFNFDYSDISIDEDYNVTLYGHAGESTTEMMSGGERIAAALAMRLGIARTLAGGSAESMLLDEPTIYLDNQRRQDLIEVLKKLSVMPQLIVVTHDTAMEEAADSISVIRKERGVSFAEGL